MLREFLAGILCNVWDTVQDGPLKIHLQHYANCPRQTRIHADRKIQGDHLAFRGLNKAKTILLRTSMTYVFTMTVAGLPPTKV